MLERVVIIGGGLAGAKGAEALREQGFAGSIHLVGAEAHLPYERPPLSKGYLAGADEFSAAQPHPAQWYADNAIELVSGVRAVRIDRAARQVELVDGRALPYDALLLATGSTPATLGVLGGSAALTLRTKEDADALRARLGEGQRVTIIGGGWIGMEVAAAAALAGAQVTVAMRETIPLAGTLGEDMGHVFAELHQDHGVRLIGGVEVSRIEQAAEGAVSAVQLSDGTRIESDTVLAGIGAVPAIELARDAGLEVGDGIHVDAALRTSDPSIYAVGDVAAAWHPFLQTRVRVEHWANALNQPATAAAAMLGGNAQYDELPFFFSDQYDLGLEYIGYAPDWLYGKIVVRGDLAAREFIAFWLGRDGRLLAGMNVNVWDVVDDVKALIRSRQVMDESALRDPGIPLSSLVLGR